MCHRQQNQKRSKIRNCQIMDERENYTCMKRILKTKFDFNRDRDLIFEESLTTHKTQSCG
jgi:hypothetical protein